jgi:alpha-glucosidase (family GH31 glycosyl hydrolase)
MRTLDTDPVADPRAVVTGDGYRITVLTDGLVRLEHAPDGRFEDRASAFATHRALQVPDFRVVDSGTHLEVVTRRFRLTYDKGPFTTSGLSVAVTGNVSSYHSVWRYGEPAGDLGGTARTLDEVDGRVALEPGVVSRRGFAVLDDSRSPVLEADGWVAPRDGSRQDLYVFAYGLDHAEALRAFYAVSGPPPLLPRWALGSWWSRYHRYSAESYLALMDRFRDAGIPFSVAVVDMDWHVTDVDPAHGSGWTGYTWNRELFPDPEKFLAELHQRGLRVTLNVHPADGVRPFEEAYPAMAAALGVPDGEPIAFDVTNRAFLTAYLEVLHRGLEEQGVDFWWVDWQSGPHSRVAGLDPLWLLNHFHWLDNARDGGPGLILSRYAGPGSHRYPIGFSGDSVISWDSLAFQPEFTATAANIGYGWWSHDVGGHMHGVKDDELATRWVQLGVFSPVLRLHSSANAFGTKEPWSFGPEAERVQTDFLRLRHRLLPYLHTMNHRAHAGAALVEPLYYRWPHAGEAYAHPTQFTFGTQLLVAPVVTPASRTSRLARVPAWLPPGTWVDLLTDLVYDGDRELAFHRPLHALPVLAPAGAIVPLDAAAVPDGGAANPEHVELVVVVGADGAFELVEDDGAQVARTAISFDQAAGTLTVRPAVGALAALPPRRTWTVTFVSLAAGQAPVVAVDGVAVEARVVRRRGRVSVTVEQPGPAAALTIDLGRAPALAPNDVPARAFDLLDAAQIEYDVKERALGIVTSGRPLHVRLSALTALGLDADVHAALEELLLARP